MTSSAERCLEHECARSFPERRHRLHPKPCSQCLWLTHPSAPQIPTTPPRTDGRDVRFRTSRVETERAVRNRAAHGASRFSLPPLQGGLRALRQSTRTVPCELRVTE